MSIIQEALKKVQKYTQDSQPPKQAQQEEEAAEPLRFTRPPIAVIKKDVPERKDLKVLIPLIITFLLVAGVAATQFLWRSAPVKKEISAPAPSPSVPTFTQEVTYKPIASAEMKKAPQLPSLMLNGIMYLEAGPRAIINNAIVETGDTIGGASVTKINRKSVVLEFKGTEITLNLK